MCAPKCVLMTAPMRARTNMLRCSVLAVLATLVACASPPRPPVAADATSGHEADAPTAPQAPRTAPPEGPVSESDAAPQTPAPAASSAPPAVVRLPHGIEVDRAAARVTIPAKVATVQGFLEQVVCGRDSREHESLLVLSVAPSEVHAALLLAGAVPGHPGRWRSDGRQTITEPPTGSALRVRVRYRETAESPAPIERDLTEWIRGADGRAFPGTWVFAGSRFAPNPPSWKRPGEHYVADYTGSIVGLVTFGDETVAATRVIPDQIDVEAANWEAWTSRMPAPDSDAILVLELAEPPTTSDARR